MEASNYYVWKAYDCTDSFAGLFAVHPAMAGSVPKYVAEEIDKYLNVETTEWEVTRLEYFTQFPCSVFHGNPVLDLSYYYQYAVEKLYMPEDEAANFIGYMFTKSIDILETVTESMANGYDGPTTFTFNYERLSESEWSEINSEMEPLLNDIKPLVWYKYPEYDPANKKEEMPKDN